MEGPEMTNWRPHGLFETLAGLCLAGALQTAAFAATPTDEINSNIESGVIKLDRAPPHVAQERALLGNPLWAIPFGSLAVTRERPIFTPSRRPPAPAVVAIPAPRIAQPTIVSSPAAPQRPNLVLVGTVISGTEGFGVFLDQSTHNVVRLRTGEGYAGWILRSVKAREATLEKAQQTETLHLPRPGEK